MAEKIKEKFKHTLARTVASNSDLGKWLKGRAAWGDVVGASPRTLSCTTGSWDHHPSNNRRCKPSYFFWILQSGWKRTLEEAQGSSETRSHKAARKQDAERAAQSEGTDENPVTIAHRPHESHPWGTQKLLLTCFEQNHHTRKLETKPWKVFTIHKYLSHGFPLNIP